MCDHKLLTFADVATESQIPLRTVYHLHHQGKGPRAAKLGRHLRVTREDYDLWYSQNYQA